MQNIIKDTTADNALQTDGYSVIPFLNEEEVKTLAAFFYKHHASLPEGMYASSHSADYNFRWKMNEEIKRVCARAAAHSFINALPLGATFMVKSKGEKGSLAPHQDWSIVDEQFFHSYNIWLPLVDVNEENGTLLILPKSHDWLNNTRGLNIPSSYQNVIQEVWQYLVPVRMKAGDAFVYDHRLLHASGINKTNTPRLVIVYGMIPESASMRYYYGWNGTIEEYACDSGFYFTQNINQGPAGLTRLRTFANNNPVITLSQLKERYAPDKSLLRKILSVFKR